MYNKRLSALCLLPLEPSYAKPAAKGRNLREKEKQVAKTRSVEELRQAVADLPPDQFERFSVWFDRYRQGQREDDDWDRQMKADAKAGKLDDLIQEAEEDIAAGRTYPLP